MSILDTLKSWVGGKKEEAVIEEAPVSTPEPVIETPVQEVAPEVTTAVEQVNDTMQDIGAMVEDTVPKTDDSIMGDSQ